MKKYSILNYFQNNYSGILLCLYNDAYGVRCQLFINGQNFGNSYHMKYILKGDIDFELKAPIS